jgi:hypothetical protein
MKTGCQWITLVILGLGRLKSEESCFDINPDKQLLKIPSQLISGHSYVYLSSQTRQKAEIKRTVVLGQYRKKVYENPSQQQKS